MASLEELFKYKRKQCYTDKVNNVGGHFIMWNCNECPFKVCINPERKRE
jgi:hypothetical protein